MRETHRGGRGVRSPRGRAHLAALADLLGRHAVEGVASTPIPRLTLHRRTRPTAEHHEFFPPALSVVVRGTIHAAVGSEATYAYDASTYVVTSLELPTVSRVAVATASRPYFNLRLALEAEGLAAAAADGAVPAVADALVDRASAGGPNASGAYWRAAMTVELLEAVVRLVQLLDEPRAVPFLGPPREREVLYRLLTGAQGARLRTLAQGGGHNAQLAAAIARLKADLARPVYVAELAHAAHMSATSFHRHFRASTTLTPVQYQKRLRLQEARRLMLTGVGAAQAALRVGYQSASQFTRDYRRAYGQPPGRDAAGAAAT